MGTRQQPEPPVSMNVYKTLVSKYESLGGWRVTFYCMDNHGRKWSTHLLVEKPEMLAGEHVFPNEIVEVEE